jgi:hypothetical protein
VKGDRLGEFEELLLLALQALQDDTYVDDALDTDIPRLKKTLFVTDVHFCSPNTGDKLRSSEVASHSDVFHIPRAHFQLRRAPSSGPQASLHECASPHRLATPRSSQ